jgi:hypothetical protein
MEPILDEMTIPELFALHQHFDRQVGQLRMQMAAVDAVIAKKERAAQTPGDQALAQTMVPGVQLG